MKEWIDEQTKRTVRQLTDFPRGAGLGYFRYPKQVPGGWIFAREYGEGNPILIEPESGEVQVRKLPGMYPLKMRESDGQMWYVQRNAREIWTVRLPDGTPELAATLPLGLPGYPTDITCDGRTVILHDVVQDLRQYPIPTTKDVRAFWHYFSRPRNGRIWAYDLLTGKLTRLVESFDLAFSHEDTSPTDPGLIKFCQDMFDGLGQRVWTVRVDGSGLTPIRPQEVYEVVTHEFWWPGGQYIGYTYQDRRGDPTFYQLPWCEYAPTPTRLGIARLDGTECYLSDPLNSYHSHIYVSPDGKWVSGEGTDGHCFVYVAPFSWETTRIEMVPLASIHATYVPFRGQHVECNFSADSRWLLFNAWIEGKWQICEVRVEV